MNYRLKAASGPLTGRHFALGANVRIGSAEDCDIRIDGLDGEHARIVAADGGLVLEAHAETALNGRRVERAALQSGDELRFGTTRLVVQAPGLKPARVLDRVPERRAPRWPWWLAGALLVAAAGAAGWWWLAERTVS